MKKKNNKVIGMIVHNNYVTDSRVRRYAEALVDNGYNVDVIATKYFNKRLVYQINKVKIYQIPFRKNRGNVINYLFEYIIFFFLGTLFLTILFFKKKYRVIHVHNMPDFLVFSAIFPKLFGVKVILDIHDPFPELFATKYKSKNNGLTIKLLNYEEKVSIKFADHLIATTDLIKSRLMQKDLEAHKICTILNSPDSNLFKPSFLQKNISPKQKKNFILLYAGMMAKRNGLENVVNSLPFLIDKIPNIRYRVVGDGDYDYIDEIKKVAKSLEIQNFVEIHPFKAIEQIPDEIIKADAVVWLPARNEFIDIVLSVKTLEALIMGKPVLTIETKCHEYYFDNEKILYVKSCDKIQIANAIIELYENYEKYKPSKSDIDRLRAKFNWNAEKQKYYHLISELIDRVNQIE
ncbi:MAG: glycosyltransferase [Candidatus Hodarchaeota archaeon]